MPADNPPPPAQQLPQLIRGAEEVLPEHSLPEKLAQQKPLRVKVGFDPTAPDLHLGHTVLIQKMRHFQECGHTVIFLIGDFTATIGDPSGRDSTRPPLTQAEIQDNATTYADQVFKILDKNKTEVRRNSEWFGNMNAADLIRLASRHTVARMLERNDFSKRYNTNQPIAIHEFLYPLVQGYDSVMLNADIELGGTDQKFNLMVGRDLQRQNGQSGQSVLTMPLLEGLDGERKMSKSYNNHIGINEPAADMYGKIMSISDTLMWRYYQMLSNISLADLQAAQQAVSNGANPMQFKKQLAHELCQRYHGSQQADNAADTFNSRSVRGEIPDDIPQHQLAVATHTPPLFVLLKTIGLAASSSEGKRLIQQGAVKIDGQTVRDESHTLTPPQTIVIQSGKRRLARLTITPAAD